MYSIILQTVNDKILLCKSENHYSISIKFLEILTNTKNLLEKNNINKTIVNNILKNYKLAFFDADLYVFSDIVIYNNGIKYLYNNPFDTDPHVNKLLKQFDNEHQNNTQKPNKKVDIFEKTKELLNAKSFTAKKSVIPIINEKISDSNNLNEISSISSLSSISDSDIDVNINDNNDLCIDSNEQTNHTEIENIKNVITELKKHKKKTINNINELKKVKENGESNLTEYDFNTHVKKKEITMIENEYKEKKRMYESAKKYTYPKIKKDIEDNKISEDDIPPMFMMQYTVLKHMEENNLFDTDDEYEKYLDLLELLDDDKPKQQFDENIMKQHINKNINAQ